MSPHAVSLMDDASSMASNSSDSRFTNDAPSLVSSQKSLLDRTDDQEVHDLVCVGFGPASLAIAIALHDALESSPSRLCTRSPKVRFLERQERFAWHAGMLLPGTKMQITFVKDMATLRNPRSHFTFLNYLHHQRRLPAFTNLDTFLPLRVEYEDYMRWCAAHFGDVVDYGQDVESVEAAQTGAKTGAVEVFRVTARDAATGRRTTLRARHVVIAAGGKPNMPACLRAGHPRVLHSSQYATHIAGLFPPGATPPRRIAVVGAGQSAAEIFHDIPARFPDTQALLFIRGSALRPSDDSPFVNEVFDPSKVDDVFSQSAAVRAAGIAADKATNYGVVRPALLEELYAAQYAARLAHGDDTARWPRRILPHRHLTGVGASTMLTEEEEDRRAGVELVVRNEGSKFRAIAAEAAEETWAVDAVVVACGYVRDSHEALLAGLRGLMPGGDGEGKRWTVDRWYGVEFERGAVRRDGGARASAGVWLQGCNEGTHGLADSLLSILAVRGGEMVESIFGAGRT